MDESMRVIYLCTDELKEAVGMVYELKLQGKRHVGFTEVRTMLNPPHTIHKYCVFYFKE